MKLRCHAWVEAATSFPYSLIREPQVVMTSIRIQRRLAKQRSFLRIINTTVTMVGDMT